MRAARAKKNPAIFSFFAGIGFLDLGFEDAGFETVFVNEIHEPFLRGYKHSRELLGIKEPKFGYSHQDIKELVEDAGRKDLAKKVKAAREESDLIGFIGGPPCPDFSVGGKNKGQHGKNGVLSSIYADVVIQQKPDFFVFENVKGLWSTKVHRAFYEQLKKRIQDAGYQTAERLINAVEYGAPQDRNRIILVGFRSDVLKKRSFILESTLQEAFPWELLIKQPREDVWKKNWPSTTSFRKGSKRQPPKDIIEELTVEYWFRKNNVEKHPNAKHYFQPRAGLERFLSVPEGDTDKKSYKRLHRWRYSPTAAYGNNEVHLHPYQARRISVAEALAVQSLPASFVLPESMTLSDLFKAVGNGVPYLAAKGIAETILCFVDNAGPKTNSARYRKGNRTTAYQPGVSLR